MRRNFPRPYTTTYLRVVVMGQLVALADSEITAFLPVVLTGFVTVPVPVFIIGALAVTVCSCSEGAASV